MRNFLYNKNIQINDDFVKCKDCSANILNLEGYFFQRLKCYSAKYNYPGGS